MSEGILAIIIAVIAAVPGLWAVYRQKRRDNAAAEKDETEAVDNLSRSALALLVPYKERVSELEAQVDKLKWKVAELESQVEHLNYIKRGARRLENQVKSLGGEPVFKVPDTGELKS